LHLLDNVVWQSLVGHHERHSSGTDRIRRYARGFSPLIGFADVERPGLHDLTPYCDPGEHFYCTGWSGPSPPGWRIEVEASLEQMVWDGPAPAADESTAVRVTLQHLPQVLALVGITQPGPFAERTIELGEYYGHFDSGHLVAMAGERMHAGHLREISGVCTHPSFHGRGLARRLIERVVRLQMQRNQLPFLHVMGDNLPARRLYERIGFRHHQEQVMRVVSRVE